MQTKIAQWGGSVAVRIPKMAVETLGLHEGEAVDIDIEGETLVLRKSKPTYLLSELVAEAKKLEPPLPEDDGPMGEELL